MAKECGGGSQRLVKKPLPETAVCVERGGKRKRCQEHWRKSRASSLLPVLTGSPPALSQASSLNLCMCPTNLGHRWHMNPIGGLLPTYSCFSAWGLVIWAGAKVPTPTSLKPWNELPPSPAPEVLPETVQ